MNATLERIGQLETAAHEDDAVSFDEIVRAVADDAAPEDDVILDVLTRNEKTADDLKAAVELLTRRRQWRTDFDRAERASAECARIDGAIRAANEDFERLRSEHLHKCQLLIDEQREYERNVLAAQVARQKLVETAGPSLNAKTEAIMNEAGTFARRLKTLDREWAEFNSQLKYLERAKMDGIQIDDIDGQLAHVRPLRDTVKAQRETAQKRLDECHKALDELTVQKLEP